jgi:hypothetical protein
MTSINNTGNAIVFVITILSLFAMDLLSFDFPWYMWALIGIYLVVINFLGITSWLTVSSDEFSKEWNNQRMENIKLRNRLLDVKIMERNITIAKENIKLQKLRKDEK